MGNLCPAGEAKATTPILTPETKEGEGAVLSDDYVVLGGALGYGRSATVR